jgi:opacity protein-like surface antigen
MRTKWFLTPFFIAALVLAPGVALAQTSIALSAYGAFSGTTTANGTQQSPSNQAGGLFQLRHTSNPVLGFEATYSFNRANEAYRCTSMCPSSPACPVGVVPCSLPPVSVPANAHEITGDWVPSVHIANVRPFGILGAGVLLNIPAGNQAETSTSTKAVYVYGAGLDWGLLPHIGLRLQYRGNLYQAPNLTKLYSSTDAFTHTAEPMIGIYFRL